MSQVVIMEQMGMHVVERIYYNNIIGYIFLFIFNVVFIYIIMDLALGKKETFFISKTGTAIILMLVIFTLIFASTVTGMIYVEDKYREYIPDDVNYQLEGYKVTIDKNADMERINKQFNINYEGEENGVGIWIVDKMEK